MRQAYIGVDVGTSSTRAGIFDETGNLLAAARHPITIWQEAGDIVEQSSADIWAACVASVRAAMAEAAIAPELVKGIGFDATCSLVVLDKRGEPLTVSGSGDNRRNVIVWMDHRAIEETRRINETRDDVLRYVGGSISPEMEMPKLLWLKRHLATSFDAAGHFFDLADYLTWRATGSLARSMCTVTCKWNYLAHERRWSAPYFKRIGLEDFVTEDFARIGTDIVAPGSPLGAGLSPSAARDLGLVAGTPVGAALIDAHAGGIGAIGGRDAAGSDVNACDRLAYIMGTSACIMATTVDPCFVPGVWGPYYSGMVPGFWLNEGGQSAAGAAIDHLLRSHPAYVEVNAAARSAGTDIIEFLEKRIMARVENAGAAALLARDVHILPEFLGNRSPYADPDFARGDRRARPRRRYRRDGAAVRGGALRARLWPSRCDRRVCRERRRQQCRRDGGRRRAQPSGSPDHGGYHRARRGVAAHAGAGAARCCDARGRCQRRFPIDRRDHGLDVGAGPAERSDRAGAISVSSQEAGRARTVARARSQQP